MTTGAMLPNGNWSYGIDISHHQPLVRWKKLRILINVKRPSYGDWRYWQFTDKGLVRGIGPVDINIKRE
jgi:GH25 family lysozyme M1 (1,4-beta-N-acetylmuramidase)